MAKTGLPVLGCEVRVVDDDGNDVPRDGETPGGALPHWHCAALCQLASAATSDIPGAWAGVISAPRQQIIAIAFIPAAIAPPLFHGLFAEARAPPFSI